MTPRLILASASPRRRDLLAGAGLEFTVTESGIDETLTAGEDAGVYAERMACAKALNVSRRRPEALVLGADTVVELGGAILLKPVDAADARRMLHALSGATHRVITAFALAGAGQVVESLAVSARVTFRQLAVDEVDAYIATGEPFDKAGGYGIQGAGRDFIAAVEGGRDTVMGLPLGAVLAALRRRGIDAPGG
jgi:septum formation protein